MNLFTQAVKRTRFAGLALLLTFVLFGNCALADDVSDNNSYESTPYEGTFDAFVLYLGDTSANDWGVQFLGRRNPGNTDTVIRAVDSKETVCGEPFTVTVEFDTPVCYTRILAPMLCLGDTRIDAEASSFDIRVYLDGEDVTDTIDFGAGPMIWAEPGGKGGTHRLAGGFDENGTAYFKTSPRYFTRITYEITANLMVDNRPEEVIEAEEAVTEEEVDALEAVTEPTEEISADISEDEILTLEDVSSDEGEISGVPISVLIWLVIGFLLLVLICVLIQVTGIRGDKKRDPSEM